MSYSFEEIKNKFGGRLVVRKDVVGFICQTVSVLPNEIIDYITTKVWVVNSLDDAWGFTFKGDELHGKHLIFLSDELFNEGKYQIAYTLLHEIGHVVLKHQNSILVEQSEAEIDQQEAEADQFAKSYLKD